MNAERITRDLGGRWRAGAGSAPCPVCQPERRRDQTALSLRDGDKGVLLFCHKSGCAFADIAEA
ncbi:MAG: virulence-associated protein E, partial [Pseudomonadota bacterium]